MEGAGLMSRTTASHQGANRCSGDALKSAHLGHLYFHLRHGYDEVSGWIIFFLASADYVFLNFKGQRSKVKVMRSFQHFRNSDSFTTGEVGNNRILAKLLTDTTCAQCRDSIP